MSCSASPPKPQLVDASPASNASPAPTTQAAPTPAIGSSKRPRPTTDTSSCTVIMDQNVRAFVSMYRETHRCPLTFTAPTVGANAPSPPSTSATSPHPAGPSGDTAGPGATSSPREEPAVHLDAQPPLNGAAAAATAKRPHSPPQEDLAKRPKDTEVGRAPC